MNGQTRKGCSKSEWAFLPASDLSDNPNEEGASEHVAALLNLTVREMFRALLLGDSGSTLMRPTVLG